MSYYFTKTCSLYRIIKVELDLSNYATKSDVKIATGADTSSFGKKLGLANLKSDVDRVDIDR